MEQVIRGFLPWEAIAKKYFAEEEEEEVLVEEAPKKMPVKEDPKHQKVQFDDLEDEDEEEEEEEENLPAIKMSDETAELDFKDLDAPADVKLPEVPKEEDPLKELESRASDSLVLNL